MGDEIYKKLQEKIGVKGGYSKDGLYSLDYESKGYASKKFRGKVENKLIDLLGREPDIEELAMILDASPYNFGVNGEYDPTTKRFEIDIYIG